MLPVTINLILEVADADSCQNVVSSEFVINLKIIIMDIFMI